ncbi:hypothetical protein CJ030_MR7G027900 [Morella rubra]|uniref:EF-hand domain-containing protein n=1 Tax=Morella rubra TaxID=262757 RepID=A0A6A1UZU8_9ROSI|nr:hypothetical protein CJ030_MR7G027900 [Morella rubra]
MENTAILREWFGRVDTEKTGSATAPQLKFKRQRFPITRELLLLGSSTSPLTVVQQMISMYDFDRNGTMSFDGKRI